MGIDKQIEMFSIIKEEDEQKSSSDVWYRMEIAVDAGKQEQRDSMVNLEAKINEGFRIALQQETPSETLEVLFEYMGKGQFQQCGKADCGSRGASF